MNWEQKLLSLKDKADMLLYDDYDNDGEIDLINKKILPVRLNI